MPLSLSLQEILIRLAWTLLAGGLIGINRSERGRPAGLRTTMLVCLAASIAMIQANLLINSAGKPGSSFVVMDIMRFPLGILSGMGFIGAAAIVRKGDMVQGVTTAATLWFVTVMGLCFGGGQTRLGLAALALGLVVLWGLKWSERFIRHERATLTVTMALDSSAEDELRAGLAGAGFRVSSRAVRYKRALDERTVVLEIDRGTSAETAAPSLLDQMAARNDVLDFEWKQGPAS